MWLNEQIIQPVKISSKSQNLSPILSTELIPSIHKIQNHQSPQVIIPGVRKNSQYTSNKPENPIKYLNPSALYLHEPKQMTPTRLLKGCANLFTAIQS